MQILSIGNSFSKDAQSYLHEIARAEKVELDTYNLYIGGCSLERHYRNMLGDFREYTLEMNGMSTGFSVSLKEALLNRDWDVVTLQQVSSLSNDYRTYQPYLNELYAYVKRCVPHARIAFHQVWAYEQGSERLKNMGYTDNADMFAAQRICREHACQDLSFDLLIPSGELFRKLFSEGITDLWFDTCHASLGIGRYALGLLWYAVLTGRAVDSNRFSQFVEPISSDTVARVKRCVAETLCEYSEK